MLGGDELIRRHLQEGPLAGGGAAHAASGNEVEDELSALF